MEPPRFLLSVLLSAFLLSSLGSWGNGVKAQESEHMKEVTVGSVVKLQHDRLKLKLHSHEVAYGSGSGQQSVTGFNGGDDANDYWVVRCAEGVACRQGDVVTNGGTIRFQHLKTRRWLHSHMHASPLSGQYEVSCFGGDGQTDGGDLWRVEVEKGNTWLRDQKVRFHHLETRGYLATNDKKYGRPIGGQHEVCGAAKKNADTLWTATEGVYFGVREQESASS